MNSPNYISTLKGTYRSLDRARTRRMQRPATSIMKQLSLNNILLQNIVHDKTRRIDSFPDQIPIEYQKLVRIFTVFKRPILYLVASLSIRPANNIFICFLFYLEYKMFIKEKVDGHTTNC